jgi:hypothetical protein
MENTQPKYEVGQDVIIYHDHLTRKRPQGKARLIERLADWPTKNDWTLVSWRVQFYDEYEKPETNDNKEPVYSTVPILEVGNPNKNRPEPVDYSQYGANAESAIDEETGEIKEPAKRGRPKTKPDEPDKPKGKRGRPVVAMNEVKARNIVRKLKNKERDEKLDEAVDFLMEVPKAANFVEKYLEYLDGTF